MSECVAGLNENKAKLSILAKMEIRFAIRSDRTSSLTD